MTLRLVPDDEVSSDGALGSSNQPTPPPPMYFGLQVAHRAVHSMLSNTENIAGLFKDATTIDPQIIEDLGTVWNALSRLRASLAQQAVTEGLLRWTK